MVTDYDSLIKLLRARADELGISRSTIDNIAGLPDGLARKLLGLGRIRRFGMETLGPMLNALGLKLVASLDHEAIKRNRSRYVPRDEPHYRSAKAGHDPMRSLLRWAEARGLTVELHTDGVEKVLEGGRAAAS